MIGKNIKRELNNSVVDFMYTSIRDSIDDSAWNSIWDFLYSVNDSFSILSSSQFIILSEILRGIRQGNRK